MAAEEKSQNHFHKMAPMFGRRTAQDCATHLLPHIKSHYRILDLGCGVGSITLDLARLVPDGSVLGLDILHDSIDTARSLAQEQDVQNIEFRQQNVMELHGLESGSFDIVHAHQLLLHLGDPVHVLQEMRRLAKPGGIVSTRDNSDRIWYPKLPALDRSVTLFDRWTRSRGADPGYGRKHHVDAHEAGFDWEHIETTSWGWEMCGTQGRHAWAAVAKSAPRQILIDAGIATPEDMDDVQKGWEDWAECVDGRITFLDSALLCWKV